MRNLCLIGLWLVSAFAFQASGQDGAMTLDDLTRAAENWAKENLDDDTLRALQDVDQEKVKRFLAEVQKDFHGQYVVELAPLKEGAKTILPLLESYEETLPYAVWLKTRLDYLDVADQFRLTIPPPKPEPGQPPRPVPNPTPQLERDTWKARLAERAWPKNASAYVSALKPVFVAQKVPPELVWLAEVESSFDPRARSPAGAAGLFQLMPATAKRYGLRTEPLDQRLRPEPSGEAAAKYLRYLHGHYADWHLALAAYNAGEGTIDTLLARDKTHSFDGIATRLPAETQLFVPKVEATVLRREGVKLEELQVQETKASR
ncbi:MAG TPA: lytic transglycosylase domain-containing protein [Candidatus Binatia bacterium]|jgi:membrane-bound lytic murein transglycosylase D|nr:lytic transglycosylase domain-containing protein [Candidatus Binatia bacterium]